MATSRRPKGGKKSWWRLSAALPQASGSSWRSGFRGLVLALSFVLGFALGGLATAWLMRPDAGVYVIEKRGVST
jgi:hypothetical protein